MQPTKTSSRPRRWGVIAPTLVLVLLSAIVVFAGFVAYEASREVQPTTISERPVSSSVRRVLTIALS